MREHRRGEILDVVEENVIATLQGGQRHRRLKQHQRRAWAGAELDARIGARGLGEGDHVTPQRLGAAHCARPALGDSDLVHVNDRLQLGDAIDGRVVGEHFGLLSTDPGSQARA